MIIYGTPLAEELLSEIKFKKSCLAVLLVGDDSASHIYVKNKQKTCKKFGINSLCKHVSDKISQEDIIEIIESWNKNPKIDGILVQLPLPIHINKFLVINSINPNKDVDGFHPINIGKIAYNNSKLMPCTSLAVKYLLSKVTDIKGKIITIINSTATVGIQLSLMLMNEGATPTICHHNTPENKLIEICKGSDIIVTAVGKRPNFCITKKYLNKESIVVDVGVTRMDKILGDVDFDEVKDFVKIITPPIGGIGPLTISFLLKNLMVCCEEKN